MNTIIVDNEYTSILAFNKEPIANRPHLKLRAVYPGTIESKRQTEKTEPDAFSAPGYTSQQTDPFISPIEMRLCLPTQKGFIVVKLDEILYCEAQKSYTRVHLLNNKSIIISKPLAEYDNLLTGTTFFRVHKSFCVNLMHIKEYTKGEGGTVTMSNDMEIDVSRRKKEQFMARIKEFFKY